jgi:hypothetical protein
MNGEIRAHARGTVTSSTPTTDRHGAFNCDMAGLPHAGSCDDVRPIDRHNESGEGKGDG